MAWLALLVAGLVAYWNSRSVPFLFDDTVSVVDNASIRNLGDLGSVLVPPRTGGPVDGRPLVNLSYALNFAVGGLQVGGYHLTNLALHVVVALLLFGVLRRTMLSSVLRERHGEQSLSLAFWISLIWLLHPLLTESVTYVSSRTEILVGVFYLLTLYAAIRAMETDRSRGWWWMAFAACMAGMATKEVMVSAPLVVFLYDRTFVAGSFREAWRLRKGRYLALASSWLLLGLLVFGLGGGSRNHTGGFGVGLSAWQYLCTQAVGIVKYLGLTVWPRSLVFDYGIEPIRDLRAIVPCFAALALLFAATLFALWRRPVPGFVGVCFFAILAPSSSLIPIGTQVLAEHRMYLPLAVVLTVVLVWAARCLERAWPFAAAGVALFLLGLTVERNRVYDTAESIWADTVAKIPGNLRAHYALGDAFLRSGRREEAIRCYKKVISLCPTMPSYRECEELRLRGRDGEVAERCARALAVMPQLAEVFNDLGNALSDLGRSREALEAYLQALWLKPEQPYANSNLGVLLFAQGRIEEASRCFRTALEVNPDYLDARYNLGLSQMQLRHVDEAVESFQMVLQHRRDYLPAWNSLAQAFEYLGRFDDARNAYEQALQIDPGFSEARTALGRLRNRLR